MLVGKELDSEASLIPVSPLSLLLSYLVFGGETGEINGGENKNSESSKEQLHSYPSANCEISYIYMNTRQHTCGCAI